MSYGAIIIIHTLVKMMYSCCQVVSEGKADFKLAVPVQAQIYLCFHPHCISTHLNTGLMLKGNSHYGLVRYILDSLLFLQEIALQKN